MDQDLLKIKGVISEVRVLRPQPTDRVAENIDESFSSSLLCGAIQDLQKMCDWGWCFFKRLQAKK